MAPKRLKSAKQPANRNSTTQHPTSYHSLHNHLRGFGFLAEQVVALVIPQVFRGALEIHEQRVHASNVRHFDFLGLALLCDQRTCGDQLDSVAQCRCLSDLREEL